MLKKLNNKKGFTLMEMLIVVAIIAVLVAIAIPVFNGALTKAKESADVANVRAMYAEWQIAMLSDNTVVPTDEAAFLRGPGAADSANPKYDLNYNSGNSQLLGGSPMDAAEEKTSLYYVTSGTKTTDGSAAAAILPETQLERQLWDNQWVIEFDPDSGSVYAVFYSEKPISYTFSSFNLLRYRSQRLSAGATVGYYGGDSVQAESTGKLTPQMEIINREQLLRITCDTPLDPLHFYVTVSDGAHTTRRIELTEPEVSYSYRTYTVTMVLDSMTEGRRFSQQTRFRNAATGVHLTPGADLTIKVEVESDSRLVDSVTETLQTNSLFKAVENGGSTAIITYARHLQNLDSASGLPAAIKQARQEQDIQFSNDSADEDWNRLYHSRKFTPIDNKNLTYFESSVTVDGKVYHPVIYGLTVDTAGDGGLFQHFAGTLRNVRLCGANISAGGSAGGLAGRLRGSTVMDGCQVYLSRSRDKLSAKTEKDIWISGNVAGGLVGYTGSCDLSVTNSFAATVIQGTESAGGLVGRSDSVTLMADRCYADCYLYATGSSGITGGLLGKCIGTTNIILSNCYAAGFQTANTTAGLVGGPVTNGDQLTSCYSACAPLGTSDRLTYSTGQASGSDAPKLTNVYYMAYGDSDLPGTNYINYESWSGSNRAEGVKILGSAFTADTGDTVPYNLMANMYLGAYSYPRLAGLTHYGDWQADFESGALAYYEKYDDGTYGFLGANLSTVKTTGTVVGDGYGMVYHVLPTQAVTVQYTLNGEPRTATLYPSDAEDMKNGYWLFPLPKELINTDEVSSAFYQKVQVDSVTYFFNPHFACRVIEGSSAPEAPEEISLRTARHLYNLSLYYEQYRPKLDQDTVFQQERSIDYNRYDWWTYAMRLSVTSQQSIGTGTDAPFSHVYDGGGFPIVGPSVAGAEGSDYAGLFGLSTGTIRNTILTAGEYSRSVSLTGHVSLRTAYAGALAGRSDGTIYNCAAAGYTISSDARDGSILYLGGLVGYNGGIIRAAGVSAPSITANSNYARLYTGGFAGGNGGSIQQSYTMASIGISQIRGDGVVLGGFTAANTGSLRSSYCATALSSPGADTYGFAPATGGVVSCYYLSGGTYRFIDSVRLYQYSDQSGAKPINEAELRALRGPLSGFGYVGVARSFDHGNTQDSDGKAYPYPGSVTGHDGSRVHYGDWVTPADMGTLGLLYWEYEYDSSGRTSGYHLSYIGYENGVYKEDHSLCQTHDDGNVITDYGYGYYWAKGDSEPSLTVSGTSKDGYYPQAAEALEVQMPGLRFVTYRTSDTGLRVTSGTAGNGLWTLTQGDLNIIYTVSPFFGDAFALTSDAAPGTALNPYQVRSVEQLQYINWSYIDGQGSTSHNVTGSASDYKYYPYLQYTSSKVKYTQAKADAEGGYEYNTDWSGNVVQRSRHRSDGGERPFRYWKQTHDLNGAGRGTAADGTAANYDFHPIAGAVNNSPNWSYNLVLYNWFGSSYDGGSYYIKNVDITSYCYNVGLFGTTADAEIKNIVLYSDNNAVIQRKTDATPSSGPDSVTNYITSYALGGLVGIAYNYQNDIGVITNCAIAGYTVADNSKNQQQAGEAAIGGLVGVSNVNLNKCSSVVTLSINCTHTDTDGNLTKADWGNYVRVGGLSGGVRYAVTDCYTGGKITVSEDLLKERIVSNKSDSTFADPAVAQRVKMSGGGNNNGPDTYVYLGGVGGSGFSANFMNFTGADGGSTDGNPKYNNCYTYMTFPAMEGTITGISLIGSIADRAGEGSASLTINNCYYLNRSAEIDFTQLPKYYGATRNSWLGNKKSLSDILANDNARRDMLEGDLSYVNNYTWHTGTSNVYTINGLTYEQMSGKETINGKSFLELLNSGGDSFHWVTTEENGSPASGKYSFPGSEKALQGQDYPFPTVLTQNTQYGQAHLHYGIWPSFGLYWDTGLLTLDMITNPTVELTLHFTRTAADTDVPVITCSKADVVQVSGPMSASMDTSTGIRTYTVTITGLQTGSTELIAEMNGYTARLLVSVTATLDISVDGLPIDLYVGETKELAFSARNSKGETLTGVKWDVIPSSNKVITIGTVTANATATVTAIGEGEDMPRVIARYTANGQEFTSQMQLSAMVRMQGVLGVANISDPESPAYQQSILTRDGTAFEESTDGVLSGAPYSNRPDYADATLFLYSQGSSVDLAGFTVTAVKVTAERTAGTGTVTKEHEALDGTDTEYRAALGEITQLSNSTFTVRPLTIKGREAGPVTLTVTLRDAEGRTFTLPSIPYTLTEADTLLTATFAIGDSTMTKQVRFGDPAVPPTAEELTEKNILQGGEITGWSPDITARLYEDTTFTAAVKAPDTAENGSPPTAGASENKPTGGKKRKQRLHGQRNCGQRRQRRGNRGRRSDHINHRKGRRAAHAQTERRTGRYSADGPSSAAGGQHGQCSDPYLRHHGGTAS